MAQPRVLSSTLDRRRFLKLGAAGIVGAGLASGCGKLGGQTGLSSASAASFPERPITMIVAYEAGGGTDVGARLLQPYLETELGGTVNVVNMPGGGGWVGWNALLAAEPDGYTIGFLNTPNLMSGYMNPELGIDHNLDDFTLIGNVVTDYGVIALRPDDDRFSNIGELVSYAQNNRLTATSTGVGSDDQLSSLALNARYHTRFEPIEDEGAADSTAAVLGGNIDVLFANVGEVTTLHRDNRLKAVAVMASPEARANFIGDVPTLAEAGYPGVESWSSRGLGGPPGIPEEVLHKLVKASARAVQNEEYVQKLGKQGLQVNYLAPKAYETMLAGEARRVEQLGDRYVW